MSDKLEAVKEYNRKGEPQETTVTFYRINTEHDPDIALINGVVYRKEDQEKQEYARLRLKLHDIKAQILEIVDERTWDLIHEFECADEDADNAREEMLRQHLLEHLPTHTPVIEHVFCPDEFRLDYVTGYHHEHCKLPAVEVNE